MKPDLAAALLVLAMFVIALMIHGCAPPTARDLCAAPPVDRKLWDKACHGLYQPRRPPEGLCSDPDGKALWPFEFSVRCKEK